MSSRCVLCNRDFASSTALQQHNRDAPAHTFACTTCNRHFASEEAFHQHLANSPAHTLSFDCESCNQSFGSEDALDQHLQNSPVHLNVPTVNRCGACDRSFGSVEALEQHLQNSRIHQTGPDTPLDAFFRSFSTFDYDPSLSPATSFARLQRHEGWQRGDSASDDAWDAYQAALESELRMWFGAEDDLAAWHALCRAIGVKPLPRKCEQCEQVSRVFPRDSWKEPLLLIRIVRLCEGHTLILSI